MTTNRHAKEEFTKSGSIRGVQEHMTKFGIGQAVPRTEDARLLTGRGRYTDDNSKMYYASRGLGPFGVKSPELPPRFREGERFALKAV